ncbi:hypothetical protein GCM10009037_20910 [Halarchaeum grantii]|uniref:Uncharacterized protein n=1 Tax=Halarchaeum grantii TaxID=1193105 RepID=A0A830FB47_9EURY|nr:DUF6653 family protein [Halarchaeum grantii]GGL37185.1 hypothetical protein GCM10009037_20910 [Halarchaeum grantii]
MFDAATDAFWERHANPKSGWSRVLLGPLLLLAASRRDPRLLLAAIAALVLNPVAFARADTADADSWMTRGVHAERWWLARGGGALGLGWPNVLNVLNVPAFAYALYAAYTRRSARALLAYAVSMALKFAWIEAIARRYDRREREA